MSDGALQTNRYSPEVPPFRLPEDGRNRPPWQEPPGILVNPSRRPPPVLAHLVVNSVTEVLAKPLH